MSSICRQAIGTEPDYMSHHNIYFVVNTFKYELILGNWMFTHIILFNSTGSLFTWNHFTGAFLKLQQKLNNWFSSRFKDYAFH